LGGLDSKPASAKMGTENLEISYDQQTKEASVKLPLLQADSQVSVVIRY
jgi:hypothetical protein